MRRAALDSRTALTEPHNVVAVGASPVSCECVLRRFERHIKPRKACRGRWVILCVAALSMDVAAQEAALPGKFYRIVDGKVDPRTYNGYRRYHAVCNHCHGPDGMGSSFGPSLVDHLPDIEISGVSYTTAKAVERRS